MDGQIGLEQRQMAKNLTGVELCMIAGAKMILQVMNLLVWIMTKFLGLLFYDW